MKDGGGARVSLTVPAILGWEEVRMLAETALRVGVGESGEIPRRQAEDFRERMADCREIRRVVMIIWQRMGEEFCGRHHVWGVGFQKDSIDRELPKHLALRGLARVEEVTGEGKECAEWDEAARRFDRPTERMHEKPAGRWGACKCIE